MSSNGNRFPLNDIYACWFLSLVRRLYLSKRFYISNLFCKYVRSCCSSLVLVKNNFSPDSGQRNLLLSQRVACHEKTQWTIYRRTFSISQVILSIFFHRRSNVWIILPSTTCLLDSSPLTTLWVSCSCCILSSDQLRFLYFYYDYNWLQKSEGRE